MTRSRHLLSLVGLIVFLSPARSLADPISFTQIPANLPTVRFAVGSSQWADFDGDGDLDILLTGCGPDSLDGVLKTFLLRNDGGGSFVDVMGDTEDLDPTRQGAWGDYDNDGDLDFVAARFEFAVKSQLYRNDGNGTFLPVATSLPEATAVSWGDYDGDGDLDLLVVGAQWGIDGLSTRVYRNDGGGVFVNIGANLANLKSGTGIWGDYDGDGDLDFLVSGAIFRLTPPPYDEPITKLYRNDGHGMFVEADSAFAQVIGSAAAWGDYDGDGDIDLVLAGSSSARIYRNDSGTFVDIQAGLPSVDAGFASWADYDNDGDLDLVLGNTTGVFRNDGADSFVFVDYGFPADSNGDGAWGDYDNDGDLDLLTRVVYGDPARIFQSNGASPNTPPSPPTNLSAQRAGSVATFSWDPSADAQTATSGLSYNLRIGTTLGGNEVSTAMAASTGFRQVVQAGNANQRLSRTVPLPGFGKFYWSVQSIDGAYAGSEFAPEETLDVSGPQAVETFSGTGLDHSSAAWGDFDNDDDLDILVTGFDGNESVTHLYRNDSGTFTDVAVGLPGVSKGSAAWGDFDRDGDLDILITGWTGSERIARIYRNDHGTFTDIGAGLPGVDESAAHWWDLDSDGDLDLILAGSAGSESITRAYRNDGGVFVDFVSFPGVRQAALSRFHSGFAGGTRILISGLAASGRITKLYSVYQWPPEAHEIEVSPPLPQVSDGALAWADLDGDDDDDLLFMGETDTGRVTRVYRFADLPERFIDTGSVIPGLSAGSCSWGDFDNDGDLDALLNGNDGTGRITKIYFQNTGFLFTDSAVELPGVDDGQAIWGDADRDGDLDVFAAGMTDAARAASLFTVTGVGENAPPSVPTNVSATRYSGAGTNVYISWDESFDQETPSLLLSYDVRIGTTPGGGEIVQAKADITNGVRRLILPGDVITPSFFIYSPSDTVFYVSVQAVDGGYMGSGFSPEVLAAKVPALPSVARVDASDGHIRILWVAAGYEGSAATVYRRTTDTGWTPLGAPTVDASGYLQFDDATASPGVRYAYRLGMGQGSSEVFGEATWAELPGQGSALTLGKISPNPAVGRMGIEFALPGAGPARVELFSVAGRRMFTRDVSGWGGGRHTLFVDDPLPSGVYQVRLTWNGQFLNGRAVVIR